MLESNDPTLANCLYYLQSGQWGSFVGHTRPAQTIHEYFNRVTVIVTTTQHRAVYQSDKSYSMLPRTISWLSMYLAQTFGLLRQEDPRVRVGGRHALPPILTWKARYWIPEFVRSGGSDGRADDS
jgi:hypothetical protein